MADAMETPGQSHEPSKIALVSLSPLENLCVGALGGALETSLQMPLLTYKFCVQEGRPLPGSLSGWYRGVTVQAGTLAPITAVQFMVNGMLQGLVLRGQRRGLTDGETIFAAAGAGAISAVVYSPVDLVTIQQQKLQMNPYMTLQTIFKQDGFHGLFRGFSACAVREAVYTSGYLGLAPLITSHLSKRISVFDDNHLAGSITGACISGTLAALVTHPVDTAKTCVQSDMGGAEWASARSAIPRLVRAGGMGSLFNGFVPRTLRICGAFFVCMSLRDVATQYKEKGCRQ